MRRLATLLSLIVAPLSLGLAQMPAQTLTLDEAIRIALERNIDVVQTFNNIASADAAVRSAWGDYLPTVSATGGWTRGQRSSLGNTVYFVPGVGPVEQQSETFTTSKQWSTGASASLTVFDGLSREANLSSAKSRQAVAERNSERARQAIVNYVVSGYLNVLRNEQLVKVSEENLKRDQRQLERITESNRVGALSLADVYRQQSQVASDELELINTQNNYAKASADLVALIGLDPYMTYEFHDASLAMKLDSTDTDATVQQYRDLIAVTRRAMSARPDFEAARLNLESASSGVTASMGSYYPSVSIFGQYGNFSEYLDKLMLNKNYQVAWGFSLRWNLFDGFLREQQVESARVQERNAQVTYAQAEKDISVEVRKALLDLEAAKKSWEVSEKALVSAREDRKIAEERYNLGAGTLLDLLVANASYVNAEAARVNAISGFFIARHNMEYMLGERTY